MRKLMVAVFIALAMVMTAVPLLTIAGGGLYLVTNSENIEDDSKISSDSFDDIEEKQLLYNSTYKYFYFEDGKYPQSYVGTALNEVLKSNITADTLAKYTLTVGGKERGVFEYNSAEYMQYVVEKDTTVLLDGTLTSFLQGGVYYFKLEPIVWRVSDYGVSEAAYPSFYKSIRTSDTSVVCVSDVLLDYGAITSQSASEGWSYSKSDMYNNINSNYTAIENSFLHSASASREVNWFAHKHEQCPVYSSFVSTKVLQASTSELKAYFSDLSTTASDLVCVLAGVNSGETCAYSTRDLKNIDVGTLITKYGVETSIWLQSQAAVRLSYTYKLEKNTTYLQSGTSLVKSLRNVSDYVSDVDNRLLTKVVFDYYDGNTYLVDGSNVAVAMGDVLDVSQDMNGSIKLFIRGKTAYILSKYHIFAKNLSNCFYNMTSLGEIVFTNFYTQETTNMQAMFYNCASLTSMDLSNWNTQNLGNAFKMFRGCTRLREVDASNFGGEKLLTLADMFFDCKSLTTIKTTNFNTRNVTSMSCMFAYCESLQHIDLSSFETSKVVNMSNVFYYCSSLTELNLTGFDTRSVEKMAYMFAFCTSLKTLNLSTFNIEKVTTTLQMFRNCVNLETLTFGNFNTKNVEDMYMMFRDCNSLKSLDLSSFDTSNVERMAQMFVRCEQLVELDISNFDCDKVTDMSDMFNGCANLANIHFGYNVNSVQTMSYMFNRCYALTYVDVWGDKVGMDLSTVTDMSHMYKYSGLEGNIVFGDWFNTENVKNMTYMFNSCYDIVSFDLSSFDTSNVLDVSRMFSNCTSLIELKLYDPERRLDSGAYPFNAEKVQDFSYMFSNCGALQSLDTSCMTPCSATTMYYMFYKCKNLTTLDLGNFYTYYVTNMERMFYECSGLKHIEFSETFDTLNVTTMAEMFYKCSALISLDISMFSSENLTNTSKMFSYCGALKNIEFGERFTLEHVETMLYMFCNCYSLTYLDLSNFHLTTSCNINYLFKDCTKLSYIYTGSASSLHANWYSLWQSFDAKQPVGVFLNCKSLPGYSKYGDTFEMAIVGGEEGYYHGNSGQGEGYFGNDGNFVVPASSRGNDEQRNSTVGIVLGCFATIAIISLFALQFVEERRKKVR